MKGIMKCTKCGRVKKVRIMTHWQVQAGGYMCPKCRKSA